MLLHPNKHPAQKLLKSAHPLSKSGVESDSQAARNQKHLDEHVIGQDEAKVLSVAVYNHYKRLSLVESKTNSKQTDDAVELQSQIFS